MQIQSAKLLFTDADLAGAVARHAPKGDGVEGIQARFTPDGLLLSGEYATGFGFKVPFETLWHLVPAGAQLHVRLGSIKVAGLPGGMLRTVLMRMVRDAVESQPGVQVHEDTIAVDVPVAARSQGAEVAVNFTAVRLAAGSAVVEAG